ncbi:hypothetical protein IAE35_21395 [Pseudomonas sp. S75]|uniref:hypothetical protein n=1 Tax=unclassified Pseudomonas TaxID=196821 RepID=UPI001908AD0D|nr:MULTISPECIES: hypothetical protein [unclassified Pseudomonas]MBJ9977892.1 hypothetical protein [Pseudomonas sp. S30]MBK0155902.1 hypothetical protein [Pseudomonas sp. S75]
MSDDLNSAYARTLRARLYLLKPHGLTPLRLSRARDKFNWTGIDKDDWLQAGGDQDSPIMTFRFRASEGNRLLFDITIPGPPSDSSGRPSTKRLGISSNGYLGFYRVATVTEPWKIEPLELDEQGLVCHLRDHLGHRVATLEDTPHNSGHRVHWLNTQEGEVQRLFLREV